MEVRNFEDWSIPPISMLRWQFSSKHGKCAECNFPINIDDHKNCPNCNTLIDWDNFVEVSK